MITWDLFYTLPFQSISQCLNLPGLGHQIVLNGIFSYNVIFIMFLFVFTILLIDKYIHNTVQNIIYIISYHIMSYNFIYYITSCHIISYINLLQYYIYIYISHYIASIILFNALAKKIYKHTRTHVYTCISHWFRLFVHTLAECVIFSEDLCARTKFKVHR